MSGRLSVLASAVLSLTVCNSLYAQTVQSDSSSVDRIQSRRVIASVSDKSIRFSYLGELIQMRLEVVDSSGYTIFDSGFIQGNVIDWPGPAKNGTRPTDGAYLCIVTVKDSSNQLTRKQAVAVLRDASVRLTRFDASTLSAAQAQVIGAPTDEDSSVIIVESNESLATAVLAHDGNSTQLVSGSNGFSIGSGNFFANKVFEHIRITAEGNVGIGVSVPQAKLDVGGMIRASQGIVFPDGSIQYSAASKTYGDKSSRPGSFSQSTPSKPGASGEQHIDAAGTGTVNFLAKWSETGGAGTLTNSAILESGGSIGIGTTNPQTGLDYHNLQAPFFTRDLPSNPGNAVGALQLGVSGAGSRLAGIGPSFLFFSENTAGAKTFMGRVSAIWENPTAGAEAGSIFFQVRANSADVNALTERMRITSAGNVGIGTPSPAAKLDVAGTINTTTQLNIGGQRVLSTPGTKNTFVGGSAGPGSAPTGCCNSFFGALTGTANTTGARNSFFGDEVGGVNADGSDNSFFGVSAGSHNTSGNFNSFFGNLSGNNNQTSDSNSFFGYRAGFSSTGGNNSFFGSKAGDSNVAGFDHTIIGANADVGFGGISNATAIGARALVAQSNSLVLGSIDGVNGAMADTSVGIGTTTPASKLEVFNGVVTSSGPSGGRFLTRNPNNQAALVQLDWVNQATHDWPRIRYGGVNEGATNGFLIQGPGDVTKLAVLNNGNVGIGTSSPDAKLHVQEGSDFVKTDTGSIVFSDLSNRGDSVLCYWTATSTFPQSRYIDGCGSSIRLKKNINSFTTGLSLIKRLRPVSFDWKSSGKPDIGLIAEDVDTVEPLLATRNNKDEVAGVKYEKLPVVLINAVKEQQAQLEQQQAQITLLQQQKAALARHNAEQDVRLRALEQRLQRLASLARRLPSARASASHRRHL